MAGLTTVAQVGTVNFHGWHGRLSSPQLILDEFARIGVVGSGSQIVGTRGARVEINAWIGAPSSKDAVAACQAVEGLQGGVYQITDDFGRIFPRVRVSSATSSCRAGLGPNLSTGQQMTFLIDAKFSMEVLP
jgi:hypothetical protein